MKPQDSFTAFVLDQLERLPGVTSKRMFGASGLRLAGAFFGIVDDGKLFFRTDAATRERYLSEGMGKFMPAEGITLHSYFEVPARVLEDAEELAGWARVAAATRQEKATRGRGRRAARRD